MEIDFKKVTVNGIITGTDFDDKTAYETIYDIAKANCINSFDVYIDGDELDKDEARDLGTDWYEIVIETSEKPSWV